MIIKIVIAKCNGQLLYFDIEYHDKGIDTNTLMQFIEDGKKSNYYELSL